MQVNFQISVTTKIVKISRFEGDNSLVASFMEFVDEKQVQN
jgi:hypothetical protein